MEEAFNKLKKDNQNTVDNLLKWMKDSKIDITDEKARQLFENVSNKKNVDIDKFKEALSKVAVEKNKTPEEIHNTLAKEAPKFLNAAKATAAAHKK